MAAAFFERAPKGTGLRIRIRLQPQGPADKVQGLMQDADGVTHLKASVTKPPEGGKANAALIKLLAKEWKVAKSDLEVLQGQTSRTKLLGLDGDMDDLTARLTAWAEEKGLTS